MRLGHAISLLGLSVVALAQDFGGAVGGAVPYTPQNRSGLGLYSVSIFSGYYSEPGFGITDRKGIDTSAGFNASMGYNHSGQRSYVSLFYAPSYIARPRFPEWNSFNQSFTASAGARITERVNINASISGGVYEFDQFLFSPARFAVLTQAPQNMDDLIAALSGRYNNDQIASLLTGAPLLESPAQSTIYGNRVLSASALFGMVFRQSPRLTYTLQASGTRAQNLSSTRGNDEKQRPLVPVTMNGQFNFGVNYSLSPTTFIGANLTSTRTWSRFSDHAYVTGTANIGHVFARRLIASVGAGTGGSFLLSGADSRGQNLIVNASLNYRATTSQTFGSTYQRSFIDTFGIGAGAQQSVMASWSYSPGRRRWSVSLNASWQEVERDNLKIRGWFETATLGYQISNSLGAGAQFFYSTNQNNGPGSLPLQSFNRNGARLSLTWYPRPVEY